MSKKVSKNVPVVQVLKSEEVSIASIHPNDYNPNRQTDDDFYLLVMSIAEDGFTDDIFVHTDGRIVDGEHRWTAMIVLNYLRRNNIPLTSNEVSKARAIREQIIDPSDMVSVKFTDMDEVKRKVATLRHNRARGDEDMALVAEMFKEFEAGGALEAVQSSLSLEDEEMERLLSYGKSILDSFPGEKPSPAWEVRDTVPGQVSNWVDVEARSSQSVSRAASTPAPEPSVSSVPGLGVHTPEYVKPTTLARRTFVFTEDEVKIVDRVLGDHSASRLMEIITEWEQQHAQESVS